MRFERETDHIYRLKIPFDDLYTSVFLLQTKSGNILVDCGATAQDVDEYIVPALLDKGLALTGIRYLVLTHKHGDHAGGKERVLEINPALLIINQTCQSLLNGATVYEMKGHTLDCIGILDERSGTLIAGDGLQGAGIKKYRCALESKEEYLKTIERIKKDERIKNVLFSHAYEPWYKDSAFGREQVEQCLQDCMDCIKGE